MKVIKYALVTILVFFIIYLIALIFADPRCKFDRNPFDCDDDVLDPIYQDIGSF